MTATVGNIVRNFMDFQIFCRPVHISFVNLLEFAQLSIGYMLVNVNGHICENQEYSRS